MIQSKSLGSKIFNVFNIILMSLLSLSCLYPLWYTLCLSVSDKAAANSGKVKPGCDAENGLGKADSRKHPRVAYPNGGLRENSGPGEPAGDDVGADFRRD